MTTSRYDEASGRYDAALGRYDEASGLTTSPSARASSHLSSQPSSHLSSHLSSRGAAFTAPLSPAAGFQGEGRAVGDVCSGELPGELADEPVGDSPGNSPGNSPGDLPGRAERFRTLRRDAARLEGRSGTARLPLGVGPLDSALAGGLALGRVHLLSGRPGHDGALTGFTVALLRRLLARRNDAAAPVVWCPAAATGGAGMLHAAGLAALGLDPGRLLIVDSPSPGQRLAALEDILRTEGLAAVVMEYDGAVQSGDYWMRLARRAQLAAEAGNVTGFLTGWPVAASGFETQWRIAPSPPSSEMAGDGAGDGMRDPAPHSGRDPVWQPVWQVELQQARGGRPCAARLCWQAARNGFRLLAAEPDSTATGKTEMLPFAAGNVTGNITGGVAKGRLPRRVVGRRSGADQSVGRSSMDARSAPSMTG